MTKAATDPIIDFLTQVAKIRGSTVSTESWLLKHGRAWTPAPLPADVEPGMQTRCFHNAATLAIRRKSLIYTEGYAMKMTLPLPFLHAWCVNQSGTVIDPTWDSPESNLYFGIAFQTPFLREMRGKMKHDGLLDCWELRWPLQRGVFKTTIWKHPITRQRRANEA